MLHEIPDQSFRIPGHFGRDHVDRALRIKDPDGNIHAAHEGLRQNMSELHRHRLAFSSLREGIGSHESVHPGHDVLVDTILIGRALWLAGAAGSIDKEGQIMIIGIREAVGGLHLHGFFPKASVKDRSAAAVPRHILDPLASHHILKAHPGRARHNHADPGCDVLYPFREIDGNHRFPSDGMFFQPAIDSGRLLIQLPVRRASCSVPVDHSLSIRKHFHCFLKPFQKWIHPFSSSSLGSAIPVGYGPSPRSRRPLSARSPASRRTSWPAAPGRSAGPHGPDCPAGDHSPRRCPPR